jgi:hypothetical protein
VSSTDDLANEIQAIESKVSELIFDSVRAQLRGEDDGAADVERRLSKVRRSLQKAEQLLRGASED